MESDIHKQLSSYESKKTRLLQQLSTLNHAKLTLKKKTASNLFRYIGTHKKPKKVFTIKNFDNIISIDKNNHTLDVEGLTSYEKIVTYTLQYGLLPTVAPELKHITIGGAIVGIGIESTGYKYGFVHDGLLEAEVLLADGSIVLCTPTNEYADLFFALANSFGTLGYILRAKIKLYPAEQFVKITTTRYQDLHAFINAMHQATNDLHIHFIDGLAFSANDFYLATGQWIQHPSYLDDIYHHIFYKLLKTKKEIYLKTIDYIFRYDPDWFWNIPETGIYNLFRLFAPKFWRNSGFYKKYLDHKNKIRSFFNISTSLNQETEKLIQDWQVPWEKGFDLLHFALANIDLQGKPWAIVPIRPMQATTLYPAKKDILYFNLGCYCYSKRTKDNIPYYNTKLMDEKAFSLNGFKMLYSSTFLPIEQLKHYYNNAAYIILKKKYDKDNLLDDLYDKVIDKI